MTTSSYYDVIIAGGGMVGLAMAAAALQCGLHTVVLDENLGLWPEGNDGIEKNGAGGPSDGRSSAISYGSARILQAVGIWPHLGASAEPIWEIRVSDGKGYGPASPLFLHYDHHDLRRSGENQTPPPLGFIVENNAMREAMHQCLLRYGERFETRLGQRVATYEESACEIAVQLRSGERLRAQLLIAADGRHSHLRSLAKIPIYEWGYGQTALVATLGHERSHYGVAFEHFLPSGPLAILPMPDNAAGHRSSLVWTERSQMAPDLLALPIEEFAAELNRRFGNSLGRFRVLGGRWSYPLSLLHAYRYGKGRMILVGDAAHAIHPIAGQGFNLGIRDVAALAQSLLERKRLGLPLADPDLLQRYERSRRPDTLSLIAVTDGLNRLFSNDIGPLRLTRDLGLAMVHRLPPLKRFFMRHAMGVIGLSA